MEKNLINRNKGNLQTKIKVNKKMIIIKFNRKKFKKIKTKETYTLKIKGNLKKKNDHHKIQWKKI